MSATKQAHEEERLHRAVALPAHGVGDRIVALRKGSAPAVLEVVDAALAHVLVRHPAQVQPHLRILVPEQRREAQVLLSVEGAPALVVGGRPGRVGVFADRMRGRGQREHVVETTFPLRTLPKKSYPFTSVSGVGVPARKNLISCLPLASAQNAWSK